MDRRAKALKKPLLLRLLVSGAHTMEIRALRLAPQPILQFLVMDLGAAAGAEEEESNLIPIFLVGHLVVAE